MTQICIGGTFICRLLCACVDHKMYFTKTQCHPDTERRATTWGHGHICNKRIISPWPHLFSGNGKAHGVPMLRGQLWVGLQYHEAHLGNNVLKPHLGGTLQFNSEPQLAPRGTAILPKRTMTEKYKIRKVTINQISKGETPNSPFKKIQVLFSSYMSNDGSIVENSLSYTRLRGDREFR